MLLPGDPAPLFTAATSVNPQFHLDAIAGRYVVLCLFGSAADLSAAAVLADLQATPGRYDPARLVLLAVTVDPADRTALSPPNSGVIYVWDGDTVVSRRYDAVGPADAEGTAPYRPQTVVLDPALRVIAVIPFDGADQGGPPTRAAHAGRVAAVLDGLPPLDERSFPVPVLMIPNVFEADLCSRLVAFYEQHGGQPSGFMREVNGKTVPVSDPSFKRRADCEVADPDLIRATQERLSRRVIPAIRQAHQFNANRIERHIVGCYDAADGGHFRAHRDNTTRGTAHRRFAVSVNLNADEFDGGELWFPEFAPRRFKPPTGWAGVFSCSLLHEVTPVTRGRRYAFLPFLYDDAAAAVRDRNRQSLATA